MPVASPAVFEKIGTRFRQAVARFAEMNDIPVVKFKKGSLSHKRRRAFCHVWRAFGIMVCAAELPFPAA